MTFTLPNLPYAHDALAPYMSKETLEFHHDKHHQAYVTNGNNAIKGTEFEGKSLEEIVKASFGKNPAVFNNAGQHYNHLHFWSWMKPNGGGSKLPGRLEKKINEDLGGLDKFRACLAMCRSNWPNWLPQAISRAIRRLPTSFARTLAQICRNAPTAQSRLSYAS